MIVWELSRCEEYYMQESVGLFATLEAAIKSVSHPLLVCKVDDTTIIITAANEHYAKPDRTQIVAGRDGKTIITCDNIADYTEGFDFYDVTHQGYDMYGVHSRRVNE